MMRSTVHKAVYYIIDKYLLYKILLYVQYFNTTHTALILKLWV